MIINNCLKELGIPMVRMDICIRHCSYVWITILEL